jgi:hypothetical protein
MRRLATLLMLVLVASIATQAAAFILPTLADR